MTRNDLIKKLRFMGFNVTNTPKKIEVFTFEETSNGPVPFTAKIKVSEEGFDYNGVTTDSAENVIGAILSRLNNLVSRETTQTPKTIREAQELCFRQEHGYAPSDW